MKEVRNSATGLPRYVRVTGKNNFGPLRRKGCWRQENFKAKKANGHKALERNTSVLSAQHRERRAAVKLSTGRQQHGELNTLNNARLEYTV